ncbi:molybdopterin-binding protein [Demequina litorisediminis]|nr:hypothetical protein [Demequina litorisediminis]
MTTRSLADHHAAVSQALIPNPAMDVLIADAVGGTLAEDIVAREPVPAFAVAQFDGYAVLAADVSGARGDAPAVLPVSYDIDFATRSPRTHIPSTAARIPSGAPLPRGADAVVALAATDGGVARVAVGVPVAPGQGVLPVGADVAAGTVLATAGTRLGPRQVAAAAALGMPRLRVHPVPRVVVLAVGDEIIDPGARHRGAEVSDANSHLLAGLIRRAGAQAFRVGPVPDEPRALRAAIEDQPGPRRCAHHHGRTFRRAARHGCDGPGSAWATSRWWIWTWRRAAGRGWAASSSVTGCCPWWRCPATRAPPPSGSRPAFVPH